MSSIECFVPSMSAEDMSVTVESFSRSDAFTGVTILTGVSLRSTETLRSIAEAVSEKYMLIYTKDMPLEMGMFALDRILCIAEDTGADMLYSDHYKMVDGQRKKHPLIACQKGALRDDFDFGSVLVFKSSSFRRAVRAMETDYEFGALYDLRLRMKNIVHINEYLYTEHEQDMRTSGEKQFDYVDPRNRQIQIEMERACTTHLKEIGAHVDYRTLQTIDTTAGHFAYEATVIIPVKNRARTIGDAVQSVLSQKTNFPFNLIVVDNYSTDGTTELLEQLATDNKQLSILIPERTDLGIGGCWDLAIRHPQCGRYAVQLDSDDLYSDPHTLQHIVDTFQRERCAMVVGSYRLCNFALDTLPPGIIDHREWTEENGMNNALRINGLGAPRAFYTPVIREI